MRKSTIQTKLEKRGYNVTFDMSGLIIASGIVNGYRKCFKADTLNGLWNLINR